MTVWAGPMQCITIPLVVPSPAGGNLVLSAPTSNESWVYRNAIFLGVAYLVRVLDHVTVIVRGVSWDETYEHALAITRIAPYPEAHSVLYLHAQYLQPAELPRRGTIEF